MSEQIQFSYEGETQRPVVLRDVYIYEVFYAEVDRAAPINKKDQNPWTWAVFSFDDEHSVVRHKSALSAQRHPHPDPEMAYYARVDRDDPTKLLVCVGPRLWPRRGAMGHRPG